MKKTKNNKIFVYSLVGLLLLASFFILIDFKYYQIESLNLEVNQEFKQQLQHLGIDKVIIYSEDRSNQWDICEGGTGTLDECRTHTYLYVTDAQKVDFEPTPILFKKSVFSDELQVLIPKQLKGFPQEYIFYGVKTLTQQLIDKRSKILNSKSKN